jgi:hypothetical protein
MGIEPTSRAATARDNGFEVWPRPVLRWHAAATNVSIFNHLLHLTPYGSYRTNTPLSTSYCARIVPQILVRVRWPLWARTAARSEVMLPWLCCRSSAAGWRCRRRKSSVDRVQGLLAGRRLALGWRRRAPRCGERRIGRRDESSFANLILPTARADRGPGAPHLGGSCRTSREAMPPQDLPEDLPASRSRAAAGGPPQGQGA